MPFAIVSLPFDVYAALPSSNHRWVLMALARYADRDGRCWPSMRQLARDARISKSSVQRLLADLSQLDVFERSRRPGGRYDYILSVAYRPRLPIVARPEAGHPVPPRGTKEVITHKHQDLPDDLGKWEARLRGWERRRMWLPFWGPKPSEPGCWAPASP